MGTEPRGPSPLLRVHCSPSSQVTKQLEQDRRRGPRLGITRFRSPICQMYVMILHLPVSQVGVRLK